MKAARGRVAGPPKSKIDRTLTHLTKGMVDPCVLTADGFVSNGHWALKLERVRNADNFASDEALQQFLYPGTSVKRVPVVTLPQGLPEKYTATEILLDIGRGGGARIFTANSGMRAAAIARRYLALGGIDAPDAVLYSTGPRAAFADRAEAPSFIVMPMGVPDTLVAEARRLVSLVLLSEGTR